VIVVDASAVVEVLLDTPGGAAVAAVMEAAGAAIHAPELIDLEIAQVLRRMETRQLISRRLAEELVIDARLMPITRHSHAPYLGRVWELRHNLTAYDAAYLALAEGLGASLVTCDAAFAAVRGRRAKVEVY
jgi:predicted nucleic acid-binding protein